MKIIGLDIGDRHTGVAVFDTDTSIALPLPALSNNRFFIKHLSEVVAFYQPKKIVVGLPLTLSGSDSPQTRKVRTLAQKISESLTLPIEFEDERFTTRQASNLLLGSSHLPPHHLDSVSAQLILEGWYNRHK